MGCVDRAGAGCRHWVDHGTRSSQRDRRARRRLFDLPCTRGLIGDTRSERSPRSEGHGPTHRDWSSPPVGRARHRRVARSLGASSGGGLRRRNRGRPGCSSDDRDYEGAPDAAGSPRSDRVGQTLGGWRSRSRGRRSERDQGRHRPCVAPAGRGGALWRVGDVTASNLVRADRRHVSGVGHASRPARFSASDRRHDAVYLR